MKITSRETLVRNKGTGKMFLSYIRVTTSSTLWEYPFVLSIITSTMLTEEMTPLCTIVQVLPQGSSC